MEPKPVIEHLKVSDNILVVPGGTSYSNLYNPRADEDGIENKERK